MTGQKLAVLAASLAGAAVLTWTLVETLRDTGVEPRQTEEAMADSPLGRMVARVGPPDRTPSAWGWGLGWDAWSRAPGDRPNRDASPGRLSTGELGDRGGRSFWDGEADLDAAGGKSGSRSARMAAIALRKREPLVSGRTYRAPVDGQRMILTSGHRIEPPRLNLPDTASVGLALGAGSRVPVRVEVCVGKTGRPAEARVIEGTGVAAVDRYVARQMLAGRYRPLWQDGQRVMFCERSTIILRRSEAIEVMRPPSECGPDC